MAVNWVSTMIRADVMADETCLICPRLEAMLNHSSLFNDIAMGDAGRFGQTRGTTGGAVGGSSGRDFGAMCGDRHPVTLAMIQELEECLSTSWHRLITLGQDKEVVRGDTTC